MNEENENIDEDYCNLMNCDNEEDLNQELHAMFGYNDVSAPEIEKQNAINREV